jgi:hypothetical protein
MLIIGEVIKREACGRFMLLIGRRRMRRIAETPLVLRNALGKTISQGGMRLPNDKRFFIAATDGNTPFDYQRRPACGDRDNYGLALTMKASTAGDVEGVRLAC